MNITCKCCDWYYKEHCCNGDSEYCTEPVSEDFSCECGRMECGRMIIEEKIIITLTDLDHILDIDELEKRECPPSELFLRGMERELEINGLKDYLQGIEKVEVDLR